MVFPLRYSNVSMGETTQNQKKVASREQVVICLPVNHPLTEIGIEDYVYPVRKLFKISEVRTCHSHLVKTIKYPQVLECV